MCSPWGSPGTPPPALPSTTWKGYKSSKSYNKYTEYKYTLKLQQQGSESCRWGILDGENQA